MKIRFFLNAIERIIDIDASITDNQIKDLFIDFVRKNGGGYEFLEEKKILID